MIRIGNMGEITQLLDLARQGDNAAEQAFFSRIYAELERLASYHLENQSPLTLIDAPALVREVYLQIAKRESLPGSDRNTFLAYASHSMRSVIVDYLRSRNARSKRHQAVTLATKIGDQPFAETRIEVLSDALDELKCIDQRAFRVVEMRYFGGMEVPEVAEVLAISTATVKRDWAKARAFLFHCVNNPDNIPS